MRSSDSEVLKEASKKFKCPVCHRGLSSSFPIFHAIKLISKGRRAMVTCPRCGTAALIQFNGLYDSSGVRRDVELGEEYYYIYATIFGLTVREGAQIEFPTIDSSLVAVPDVYTPLWEVISFKTPGMSPSEEYDIFICHAHEDKEAIARPLAEALREQGVKVWYDEFSLKLGDSLRRCIDHGLGHCRYGVVILSPRFFAKEWPQRELDGLVAREAGGRKVILPIWHEVDRTYVERSSPSLADKFSVSTSQGLPAVVNAIKEVLSPRLEGERKGSTLDVLKKATEVFECPTCHKRLKESLDILDQVTLLIDSHEALVACPECGTTALFRLLGLYRSTGEKVEIKKSEEYYYVFAVAFGMTFKEGPQTLIPEMYLVDFSSLPTDVYSARWFVERFSVPLTQRYGRTK